MHWKSTTFKTIFNSKMDEAMANVEKSTTKVLGTASEALEKASSAMDGAFKEMDKAFVEMDKAFETAFDKETTKTTTANKTVAVHGATKADALKEANKYSIQGYKLKGITSANVGSDNELWTATLEISISL
jgi:hypothetical protein